MTHSAYTSKMTTHSIHLLAFEAATQICSVALLAQDKLFYRSEKTPQKASNFLLPMIDAVLKEAHVSLSQLDAIAVGHGPGSFMGIRLAIGIAQGLAYPNRIPVIDVSTLQILAQTAYQQFQTPSVLAAWDARMQEIYYGAYQLNAQGLMVPVIPDQLIAPHQFIPPKGKYTLAGNAWEVYFADFSEEFKQQWTIDLCQSAWIYPDAKGLLAIAKHRFSRQAYTSAENVCPVYLRDRVTS
jgi:tRNA threonylcarbamoyladenosine biosynthesis protein TsaB